MKRRIVMDVTIEEHDDGACTVWIRDVPRHELITVKRKNSTYDASIEIGAVAFEMAEEVEE